jgi:hypothetical protein
MISAQNNTKNPMTLYHWTNFVEKDYPKDKFLLIVPWDCSGRLSDQSIIPDYQSLRLQGSTVVMRQMAYHSLFYSFLVPILIY